MIKNYFKTAVRNLFRNKVYSTINIAGLSIGLAGCLIVANFVIDDLSYDKQWKNAANIYRVTLTNNGTQQTIPVTLAGLGPSVQKNFPEVNSYCRLTKDKKQFSADDGENKFTVNCITSEPSFLNIFDFDFLKGSPKGFTSGYANVIITQKIKDEYFPTVNPVGKIIHNKRSDGSIDTVSYLITGVIKTIPYNSHLRADVIVLKQFTESDNELSSQGVGFLYPLYVSLKNGTNLANFTVKVNSWYKKTVLNNVSTTTKFQPLGDVYLHSDFAQGYQPVIGSIRNVYIFSGVAFLLLLIACLNFINLTTARALKRIPEAGVRKILGAAKFHLIIQFLFESLIFFVISFLLAIVFFQLSLNPVEAYLGHSLTVSVLTNIVLFAATLATVLLVCVFTGLYPALVLSRGNPSSILKGTVSNKTSSIFLRKSLVVVQFTISIIIVIATLVVRNQLHFFNNKEIGYDKNNLIQIDFTNLGSKGQAFKQQIKSLSGVQNVCIARWAPGNGSGSMTVEVNDPSQKDKKINLSYIEADIDFASTLKLKLQRGRLLNSQFVSDTLDPKFLYKKKEYEKLAEAEAHQSVLLTSYTEKTLEVKELNQPLFNASGIPVGVINDFYNESLHTIMKPCIIKANNNINYGNILIRINAGAGQQVINSLNRIWNNFYPDQTLQYTWVSDNLQKQYNAEQKMQQLFFFFSYLTVFLSCLGLFGLVSFTTEQRTKEIGIRKILGASVSVIVQLLSKEYFRLVVIAILIATPIAWWIMNKWLQNFAYRIQIEWWLFVLAGFIGIAVALITVSFQAIKAATANPVKSLRTE
ncbi:MAG: FtsX-like permease family protein [Chitinophagaceae bacterium]|nr:FtsX-like permease family protein [Chitinophagaceae bacterium]